MVHAIIRPPRYNLQTSLPLGDLTFQTLSSPLSSTSVWVNGIKWFVLPNYLAGDFFQAIPTNLVLTCPGVPAGWWKLVQSDFLATRQCLVLGRF